MKKLLISLLLIMPISVFAKVDQTTTTTIWNVKDEADAETKCLEAVKQNGGSSISSATAGYYLECIKVSCTNSKNVHQKLNTYAVGCANGNKNPNAIIDAGAPSNELKAGASCTETGAYVYFTQKTFYNCSQNADNSDYTPSNPSNPGNKDDGTSNTPNNNEESPNTGVEDYYLALTASAAILIGGLFILNKKNVFKKI
ncbi:MAG: hypothetical protein Q4C38_04550 [bacterium]|nr:hypothetical protein [bacterium]